MELPAFVERRFRDQILPWIKMDDNRIRFIAIIFVLLGENPAWQNLFHP
jgi:hypothetical protein